MTHKNIQHGLDFSAPTLPQTIEFSLAGATVYAVPLGGDYQKAHLYLNTAGLSASFMPDGQLVFPFKNFKKIGTLTPLVTQILDTDLRVFRTLLDADKERSTTFYIDRFASDEISISWEYNQRPHSLVLKVAYEYLLLMLGLPYVYSTQAQKMVAAYRTLPLIIGHARKTLQGHVEIDTQIPQMLEDLQIPYLFRISPGLYGVPASQAEQIKGRKEIVFAASPTDTFAKKTRSTMSPVPEGMEDFARELGPLSSHMESTASLILGHSARREMIALMLMTTGATNTLVVVAHPKSWWLWYMYARHLGLSVGSLGSGKDVLLIDYDAWKYEFHRITCDGIVYDAWQQEVHTGQQYQDTVLNCRRMSLLGPNPGFAEKLRAAYLVRPVEFKSYLESLSASGHPRDVAVRQHMDIYTRDLEFSTPTDALLPLAGNIEVSLSPAQKGSPLLAAPFDLDRVQEVLDIGSSECISPKVSAALELAVRHDRSGSTLTIVTLSTRTADMINSLCTKVGLPALAVTHEERNHHDVSDNILYYNTCMNLDEAYTEFSNLPQGGNFYYLRINSAYSTAMDVLAFNRSTTGNLRVGMSPAEAEYVKNLLSRI